MLSQSLKTGEPLHEVLHQRLVGRLFYHHQHRIHLHSLEDVTTEQMASLNYMYYATAVVAAFQLFQVGAGVSPALMVLIYSSGSV